jgi:hypothetical protein
MVSKRMNHCEIGKDVNKQDSKDCEIGKDVNKQDSKVLSKGYWSVHFLIVEFDFFPPDDFSYIVINIHQTGFTEKP